MIRLVPERQTLITLVFANDGWANRSGLLEKCRPIACSGRSVSTDSR
jgi:hypothetical protein